MKLLFTLFFVCTAWIASSQINEGFTSNERAYLFHIIKKSPILNHNLGRFIEYTGPEVLFRNGKLNYDSVETIIINNPGYLKIYANEIAKSPKGLLAEAANKMAIWELNKTILSMTTNQFQATDYANKHEAFIHILLPKLPPNAIITKDGKQSLHPKLTALYNPSLTFDEKVVILSTVRFLNQNDQIVCIRAVNAAINEFVEKRALEIFQNLGGKADQFNNVLIAAGDGSSTSGLLEEREKDEKGRWNRGLPKAVGLFPYQVKLVVDEESKKQTKKIEPLRITENNFQTPGKNRLTNIHLDVWGYNTEKQTTVVIEKNGLSYHLFGSAESRFLSPDSTFSSGKTFQSIINDLEFNKIANLQALISGKKGFDYWIDYQKKRLLDTETKINKTEKEYSDLGYRPITTKKKASGKVKKSKRQAIKSGKQSFDGFPTTNSNSKNRKKIQNKIVHLHELREAIKAKINELEKQKEEAKELIGKYHVKLSYYKLAMGQNWARYTEKDGIYLFQDSSTFNITTQEFQFKETQEEEDFEIRLISIPASSLSKSADEVMLHINITDALPKYDSRIRLDLMDVFAPDDFNINQNLFAPEDSLSLTILFEQILEKKNIDLIIRAQGIGKWNGSNTVKDHQAKELNSYPNGKQMDTSFVRLRKTDVLFSLNETIQIEINSYTDPVKSNFKKASTEINQMAQKYKWSTNEVLSAYRCLAVYHQLKKEINFLAGTYLSRDEAKTVIDRFNKAMMKAKITIGREDVSIDLF